MSGSSRWHDVMWTERYGHVCPPHQGTTVHVQGIGGKDAYNPALYEYGADKVLAFRTEARKSSIFHPHLYHPAVYFARLQSDGLWHVDPKLPFFDMLEDPFFFYVEEDGMQKVVFGGVRAKNDDGRIAVQTEFYKGESIASLERTPFAIVHNMKDVRLLQLPDGRFLLCRRPWGDEYKRGRIALHIIENLNTLANIDAVSLPLLALLDSCQDALDWVGINNVYILKDSEGRAWVGLLGHVALESGDGGVHYAVCTYKISLQNLLEAQIHKICPKVIAIRSCFEDGPAKHETIQDVVFPGHLEHVDHYTYRLWAGLSDARIGTLEIEDPFALHAAHA